MSIYVETCQMSIYIETWQSIDCPQVLLSWVLCEDCMTFFQNLVVTKGYCISSFSHLTVAFVMTSCMSDLME